MKKRYLLYLWLAHLLAISGTKAQEPVAPNGKFATVNGLTLYYEESGKGMPLVLLHAFTRTANDWRYHPEFARSYRVIAVDLPGHGRSDAMDTTQVYRHKKAAEYILGLLAQLHVDSAYVMGASSGGFITMYMATLKPQLTRKIILVGAQVYYSAQTRKAITAMGPGTENPAARAMAIQKHGNQKGRLLLNQFWQFRKLYGDPSFTPDVLATIQAQTLLIHGDDDPLAPVANAWELFQHIPNAHLWIVPNGGHAPMVAPGNLTEFNRRVLDFLSTTNSPLAR